MARYNPDFWEIPTDVALLDRVAATSALWYESDSDRDSREAQRELFEAVAPVVRTLIESTLTPRQREVLLLYYYFEKTQEDIAAILQLSQSTVSRHLFGTARNGRKVGGAIRKLQKAMERKPSPAVNQALQQFRSRVARAA